MRCDTMKNLHNFIEQALEQPVLFAQVREDSLQDIELIKSRFPEGKIDIAMVASGGCTAAALISETSINSLTLVDANPSQIALTKLKLHLMQFPIKRRLEILGHESMDPKKRKSIVEGMMLALDLPEEILGDLETISELGLDFIGRYEIVFDAFRQELKPHQSEIETLFVLESIQEQLKIVSKGSSLGDAIDAAFQKVFSQDNLVTIFGLGATANRIQSFADHFAERTRIYLSSHLAKDSPYFAQLLLGRFHGENVYPWLKNECSQLPECLSFYLSPMNQFLKEIGKNRFDLIHLSNILDWLPSEEAEELLDDAIHSLKPGGAIIIRQLNSNLDLRSYKNSFLWDSKSSSEYHRDDRSFFYRDLHIGFKPHVSRAPNVQKIADQILTDCGIFKGPFFESLRSGKMSLDVFRGTQIDFFYAVDFFSKPMAALIAKLDQHEQRIDILHNIVEEHGDFNSSQYHSETFRQFLKSLGLDPCKVLEGSKASPAVDAFNTALIGAVYSKDPLAGIGCIGIIEYAFAEISATIGNCAIDHGWIKRKELIHYGVHAELDKTHAEDFFILLEPYINNLEKKDTINSGLKLGAHIFNELYRQLFFRNIDNVS